jgi:putative oxidoreductase
MAMPSLDRYRGIGLAFAHHGYPKIRGGPDQWEILGGALKPLGIDLAPTFFGFMAAASEFGGGILVILGFFFRPAAFLMFCTMCVALATHLHKGDSFMVWSHAAECAVVFLGLVFTGPGKFSLKRG